MRNLRLIASLFIVLLSPAGALAQQGDDARAELSLDHGATFDTGPDATNFDGRVALRMYSTEGIGFMARAGFGIGDYLRLSAEVGPSFSLTLTETDGVSLRTTMTVGGRADFDARGTGSFGVREFVLMGFFGDATLDLAIGDFVIGVGFHGAVMFSDQHQATGSTDPSARLTPYLRVGGSIGL